jgi:hypothetical protein
MLKCHWYDTALSVYAPTEDKIDMINSFYEELERVFDKFSEYCMKIVLGGFSAKVGKEDIFKSTVGNESFREVSNDNGVRLEDCKGTDVPTLN